MSFSLKFSNLGHPNRIWTISAINGQLERLVEIHKALHGKLAPGDRLIYTGNYLGGREGAKPLETLDELLFFRRTMLAREGMMPEDFVYLRGIQEELLGKILQLQFAPDAEEIVNWIEKNHPEMNSLLSAYGSSLAEAGRVAREGVINLTRWTTFLKKQMREREGHEVFYSVLRRAAFTENRYSNDNNLLFVHAGVDPDASLTEQADSFWWAGRDFNALEAPCQPFKSVVRGFDPAHRGIHIGKAAISIDGGCGYGGKLVCARLSDTGDVQELIAA
jgi:hypothetical protein